MLDEPGVQASRPRATQVRLGGGTAARIGSLHDRASAAVLQAAATAPAAIDAGDATEALVRLLVRLADTADQLVDVNAAMGVLVGVADRHLDAAEQMVAEAFLDLRSAA